MPDEPATNEAYATAEQFMKHLGKHLVQLALFSLPGIDLTDESDDDLKEIQTDAFGIAVETNADSEDDGTSSWVSDLSNLRPEPEDQLGSFLQDDKVAKEEAAEAAVQAEEAEKKVAKESEETKTAYEKALEKALEEAKNAQEILKQAKEAAERLKPSDAPKPPIKFMDAVGRRFSFPWHHCKTWKGMEELIKQAFLQVDIIGPHVHEGHYDLVGPDGEIILPQVWETMVQPDWAITMHMWPMPEPPAPPSPPPPSNVPPPPPHHDM
ncbi:hypothetical protein SLS60_011118 [Paraconiothyrium brasiliense]|uniref:Ubiquitin-like domain-containing protein n=1 Tax=Paraconiothyrium brasiliense TaxID=300254 RepID=A0ABR3QKM1_9PLEO